MGQGKKLSPPKKNKLKEIPAKIYLKYALLQIPGIIILSSILFLLYNNFQYPWYINVIILTLWIIKDIIMFPFIWPAYDGSNSNVVHTMIGKKGVTRENLNPDGYVHIGRELWKAELIEGSDHLAKGKPVKVEKIQGLTLIVSKGKDKE